MLGLLADIGSLFGLVISLVGFFITIRTLRKTKSAAESATLAATETKQSLSQFDAIVSISSAVAAMEEIKRLHREEAWSVVLDRYSSLRRMITAIITGHKGLNESQKKSLRVASAQFRELEELVEAKVEEIKSHNLNKIVSAQLDKIDEILNQLKSEVG